MYIAAHSRRRIDDLAAERLKHCRHDAHRQVRDHRRRPHSPWRLADQRSAARAVLRSATASARPCTWPMPWTRSRRRARRPVLEIIFETLAQERAAAITVEQNRPDLVVLGDPPYRYAAPGSAPSAGRPRRAVQEDLQDNDASGRFDLMISTFVSTASPERRIASARRQAIIIFIACSWLSYSLVRGHARRLLSIGRDLDRQYEQRQSRNGEAYPGRQFPPVGVLDRHELRANKGGYLCRDTGATGSPQHARGSLPSVLGVNKRLELLATLNAPADALASSYTELAPTAENRFLLRPGGSAISYPSWAGINEISRASDWSGVLEKRLGALMAHDKIELRERMARYCDPKISFDELRRTDTGPVVDAAGFNAERARNSLLEMGGLNVGTVCTAYALPVRPTLVLSHQCAADLEPFATRSRCTTSDRQPVSRSTRPRSQAR